MQKLPGMAPNGAGTFFFPANPYLADILGDMDVYFENFHIFYFLDPKFLDFQVPRFPKSGLGRAGALGLAPGLARETSTNTYQWCVLALTKAWVEVYRIGH